MKLEITNETYDDLNDLVKTIFNNYIIQDIVHIRCKYCKQEPIDFLEEKSIMHTNDCLYIKAKTVIKELFPELLI